MSLHDLAQGWIVCGGLASAWLMTSAQMQTRKWGYVTGIMSQPAWLYATWTADQWGNFFMACVYTAMWIRGIYNNWRQQ